MRPGKLTERISFRYIDDSGGGEAKYTQADFGDLSAFGDTFQFTAGDLTTVVSVGDSVEFALISSFGNRGPFTVSGVTTSGVTVDATLETMGADSDWEMTVTSTTNVVTRGEAWAHVEYLSGEVRALGSAEFAFRDYRFTIRRPSELPQVSDTLVWRGVAMDIKAIADLGPREPYLTIEAEYGAGNQQVLD